MNESAVMQMVGQLYMRLYVAQEQLRESERSAAVLREELAARMEDTAPESEEVVPE